MPTGPATYAERLLPPWWVWAFVVVVLLLVPVILLALVPPLVALLAGLALLGATAWALVRYAGRVEVSGAELRAGRAHIPVGLLGRPVPLDPEQAGRRLGLDLDARAHHFVRGWVRTGLVVDVTDPEDPTPYWYVSTRRPRELARAIEQARTATPPAEPPAC